MVLPTEHDKVWIIECRAGNQNSSVMIRGGICVSEEGIILTTYLDITSDDLRGRNPSSDEWFDLTIVVEKPNFNLVLLGVKEEEDRKDKLGFPFFNLNDENVVNLSRGDRVHGLLHSFNKPFTCSFGHSCRPFRGRIVEFPSMDSRVTLDAVDDSILEFWDSPIAYLCTKHVIKISTDLDLVLEHYNFDDDDDDDDDDEEEDWDNTDDFSLDDDEGEDCDNNNTYLDDEMKNPLRFLHPDIPVIQVRGFGGGIGSEGGAVFDANHVFIGIYYFNSKCFQYILPKSFLALFVRDSIASLEKIAVPSKQTPMRVEGPENPQSGTSDEPQSGNLMEFETDQRAIKMDLMLHSKGKELISAHQFKDALKVLDLGKDVESVVDIFKEAKDNKAEKLADDQKCRVEIKEQKCGKTLLAKADDMQKLDPLVSNSFEEVAAEALWRQEYDTVKALDNLTNPVTKPEIQPDTGELQLDLKSKKRRRHQRHVEARVSELASTGFDISKARNSQGTTSEAFGELLEKDVMIASVCEHTRCAEPTAASLNGVDSDGERPSTFADGNGVEERDMEIEDAFLERPSALDVVDSSPHSA